MIDEDIALAFALTSGHGEYAAYAVLLGAGVSAAAGVPSAWGVQEALIRRLAATVGEEPGDAFAWYQQRFGQPSTYDGLLAALTGSQTERQGLLRGFFEPTGDERAEGLKSPTAAHVAIARLVKAGLVRVILTTNFDRLIEAAVRAEGIEPTVVATPADIAGLNPLHTVSCLIVHVHGDYLSPTGMLNTADELATYPDSLNTLLDRILDDYGLVIAGWSATWDHALRAAISRTPNRRYTTYWIEPFDLSEIAEDLRIARSARAVRQTADAFFGRVADACDAITEQARRHPASVAVAVASAKRSLSGGRTAIDLHDQIREQVELVRNLEPVTSRSFNVPTAPAETNRRIGLLECGMETLLALVATAAYWGNERTDRWWFGDIERFAEPPIGASGSTDLIEMTRAPATYQLYAAGVAAVAAGRWPLVARLLTEPTTETHDQTGRRPVAAELPPQVVIPDPRAARRLHKLLAPLFTGYLALGDVAYLDAWDRFEYLRVVSTTDEALTSHRPNTGIGLPHLRAIGNSRTGYHPATSDWLRTQIAQDAKDHPLLVAGLCGGDIDRLRSAQEESDEQFSRLARDVSYSMSNPPGNLPAGFWYPDESRKFGPLA